jgi:AcrR family transcriptional regulator
MRKSAAKQRILDVAHKLIKENGYATLNVNDIAYQAEVSIGTLYYHFPKGKSSILLETRKQIASEYNAELQVMLKKQDIRASQNFMDGLRAFLEILLQLHRKDRQYIIAMEAEILANIETYLKAVNNADLDAVFSEEINATIQPIAELMKQFPEEPLSIKGKEKQLHKVVDTLIHRHIYFGYNFGTDTQFIDMLTTIVYTLLKT